MSELRWILLVAGVLLIAGIYLWGVRARRRSAAPEHERVARVEPARTVAVVAEPARVEPEVAARRSASTGPRSPTVPRRKRSRTTSQRPRERAGRRASRAHAIEPRFGDRIRGTDGLVRASRAATRAARQPAPTAAEPQHRSRRPPLRIERPAPRTAPAQKIVAIRVVAAPGTQFGGAQLAEALAADGFTFGRYQIFHRLDASGRPVVSVASLKEPGTFDPERMAGAQFRGVALFAVMPGPLPGLQAFDELIVTARALAAHLGWTPAGRTRRRRSPSQRIAQLRDEIAAVRAGARGAGRLTGAPDEHPRRRRSHRRVARTDAAPRPPLLRPRRPGDLRRRATTR